MTEKKSHVNLNYNCLPDSEGKLNTISNSKKDYSYFNSSVNNIKSNIHLDGIKFLVFNTPKHKKVLNKAYEILNSYDDDNLIKGLNQDKGNKNRQIRAINQENNIHSFGEFKKSYQNETYSKENIHGFKNNENKKFEIKEEKNKFFYLKNENNSGLNFSFSNKYQNESIFNKEKKMNNETQNENAELNELRLISKFVDYMELMEKKENPNVSYMEMRKKYSKVWNELKNEDKMIFALFDEMERNNQAEIKNLIK